MKQNKIQCILVIMFFCVCSAQACTDFILEDSQNHYVVGRSMEFGTPLQSEIVIYPRGEKVQSWIFNHQKGLSWVSRYGYIAITVFRSNFVTDGLNEKGLSLGLLWLPGSKYPSINPKEKNKTIAIENFSSWILGNFATVEEVKQQIRSIQIWAHEIPQLGKIPPVHVSLHDRLGNSLVIEFIEGKMNVIDNVVGVLTNAPEFSWQKTNLSNYINLSAINKNDVRLDGTVIGPAGQGSGLLGIPGDWTPPSRFVRIAIFKNAAQKAKNAKENINLAFHLLNTVDIPYGTIRSSENTDFDYTKWAVGKDLANGKFYYRSYGDLNIKMIDLNEEKLSTGSKIKRFSLPELEIH